MRPSAVAKGAVTDVSATPNAGCVAYLAANQADFTMSPSPVTENTTIPSGGASTALPNGATLSWANNATADQTGCAGETLKVAVTIPARHMERPLYLPAGKSGRTDQLRPLVVR